MCFRFLVVNPCQDVQINLLLGPIALQLLGNQLAELLDSHPLDGVLDARLHQVLAFFVLLVVDTQRSLGVEQELLYRHELCQSLRHLWHR